MYAAGYFSVAATQNLFELSSLGSTDMVLMKLGPTLYTEWILQAGGATGDAPGAIVYLPGRKAVAFGASLTSRPYLDFNRKKQLESFFLAWYYE